MRIIVHVKNMKSVPFKITFFEENRYYQGKYIL